MGQIIRLPVTSAAYPDASASLEKPECILLIAVRWWVADYRKGEDPLPRLCRAMETAGAEDAAFSVDRLMEVVARTARRSVEVRCPRCPAVSDDEKQLLHAASLAQSGHSDMAERALRIALLSSHGAEFAVGPLEGLGEVFAAAGLRLRLRRPAEPERAEIIAWTPPALSQTVH